MKSIIVITGMSGTSAGSALAGSPGQIQMKRCFSSTGKLRTQAEGFSVS